MCGIAGAFAYGRFAAPIDEAEIARVNEAMARRGPDGAGLWMSPDRRAALAHRRLAIVDLSQNGAQPMASADGRYHITFNGEIYNYRELRERLSARGFRFRSASDTEVLLQLYADRGEAMVHDLRGMFAFAIYDCQEGTLFAARDPFGIKPFYYADDGNVLRFASQVKALLKAGVLDTAPDPAGHVGFFLLGSVPEPFTLFRAIRPLPAGHTLCVRREGAIQLSRYFSVAEEHARAQEAENIGDAERLALLREALVDSVRHHLVADVPVGIFLSAGLDSSTIAALARLAGAGDLRSLTLGFEEYRGTAHDEAPAAEETARRLGLRHSASVVRQADFNEELPAILAAMDQPSIDGINTYLVSRAAAAQGMKVALSGLGGDELFGGYPSFTQVPRSARLFGPLRHLGPIGRIARRALAPFVSRISSPKYASVPEYGTTAAGAYFLRRALYMPWELADFLDERTVRDGLEALDLPHRMAADLEGLITGRQIVSTLEMSWYMRNQLLRDADWAGMAHSVEIRVPLVDVTLLRAVAPWARTERPFTKAEMAASAQPGLSEALAQRPKTGFTVPLVQWASRRSGGKGSGYRAWARQLDPAPLRSRNVSVLLTDAFGGHGGIAKFNRDLLTAMACHPLSRHVTAFPRLAPTAADRLPHRLSFIHDAAGNKLRYALKTLAFHAFGTRSDLVISGHLNLLPLAWICSMIARAPLVLIIHGKEAWDPPGGRLTRFIVGRIDRFAAVSATTKERFLRWSGVDPHKGSVLPDSVDVASYSMRPKNPALTRRLGLENRTVIMTMSRLSSGERYKGHDEVIEALPQLIANMPDLVYLIVGDGDDRARLEDKVRVMGLQDRVVFTGFVPEIEKCDYYSLADAFVMPGSGEGFGIVYLEAMASGLPVLGSALDGSREALRDGMLGVIIDPRDPRQVLDGIAEVLRRPKQVPEGLQFFDLPNFQARCHRFLEDVYAE